MSIIVFDTETTGLLAPIAAGHTMQPHMIELCAIKLDRNLEPIDGLQFYCRPPIEIPEQAIKVHGITNEMIAQYQPFAFYYSVVCNFFLGSTHLVGHNLMFDKMILYWELVRMDKQLCFPWSPGAVCTAEVSQQMKGYRMHLGDLFVETTGKSIHDAHTATGDVEMTVEIFRALVKQERIQL